MKTTPTKEQVLDALATHKRIYKAAAALHVSAPTFGKYMKQYGICVTHALKEEPAKKIPWYKRLLFPLLLSVVLVGCNTKPGDLAFKKSENATYGWTYLDNAMKYRTVVVDGHEYLVFVNDYRHGQCVVHSESCPCKKKGVK